MTLHEFLNEAFLYIDRSESSARAANRLDGSGEEDVLHGLAPEELQSGRLILILGVIPVTPH